MSCCWTDPPAVLAFSDQKARTQNIFIFPFVNLSSRSWIHTQGQSLDTGRSPGHCDVCSIVTTASAEWPLHFLSTHTPFSAFLLPLETANPQVFLIPAVGWETTAARSSSDHRRPFVFLSCLPTQKAVVFPKLTYFEGSDSSLSLPTPSPPEARERQVWTAPPWPLHLY